MDSQQSSGSNANSFIQRYGQVKGPLCHCSKRTVTSKSWTDENPGKMFYRCDAHGFFSWADKDKPYGWQKMSLVEVRDQIRCQKEEIKNLKESLRRVNHEMISETVVDSSMESNLLNKISDENKKLEFAVTASKGRENCFANSWLSLGEDSLLSHR